MTRDPQTIDLFVGSAEICGVQLLRGTASSTPASPGSARTPMAPTAPTAATWSDTAAIHSKPPGSSAACALTAAVPRTDHRVGWPACARFEAM